jgi:lauroyl/myristoyl acyltransferase
MKENMANILQYRKSVSFAPNKLSIAVLLNILIEKITHLIVTQKNSRVVPKTRKNLSLVTHLPENDPQIEQWIRKICRNMLFSYLELFRGLAGGQQKISEKIDVDRKELQCIYQVLSSGKGVILAGIHTCGFDHAIYALNDYLPKIQILSKANPTGGTKLMYLLRKLHNILITPLSVSALKKAVLRLRSGGLVAVAIDIPIDSSEGYKFFNQDAHLTDAHTRLAVKSGAKIFLVYTRRTSSGRYQIKFQEVKQPENHQDKKVLISAWAQKSYQQVEYFILRWPEAWYGSTFDLFTQVNENAV